MSLRAAADAGGSGGCSSCPVEPARRRENAGLCVDRPPLPALASSCYKCRVTAANPLVYPHITHHGGVRSGEPVVEGTRIPVVALVRAHQLGMDFDEILVQFPGLAPEGLHAALLYYLDHRAQIDALIARDLTPPSGALELEG